MQYCYLKDIAEISIGLLLNRKKANPSDKNIFNYKAVSLKSFNDKAIYDPNFEDDFFSNENLDQYKVQKNDILVRLREPNFAILMDKNYPNLIYSSLIAKIKIKDENFNPFFIAHFLNSNVVKKALAQDISGTTITSINIKNLENIKAPKTPLKTQTLLAKYIKETNKKNQILNDLINLNTNLQKNILEDYIKG